MRTFDKTLPTDKVLLRTRRKVKYETVEGVLSHPALKGKELGTVKEVISDSGEECKWTDKDSIYVGYHSNMRINVMDIPNGDTLISHWLIKRPRRLKRLSFHEDAKPVEIVPCDKYFMVLRCATRRDCDRIDYYKSRHIRTGFSSHAPTYYNFIRGYVSGFKLCDVSSSPIEMIEDMILNDIPLKYARFITEDIVPEAFQNKV